MSMSTRFRAVTTVAALSLLLAACAATESEPPTTGSTGESDFTFGSPADAADSDRTVEISATDELTFEPAELIVTTGETVTFRIANTGTVGHDFTLGDQTTQDEHEAEMAEMGGMAHDQANVVTIPAGETKELTWTFTETGTVLIGCHQTGHYAGGMKGEVIVEP